MTLRWTQSECNELMLEIIADVNGLHLFLSAFFSSENSKNDLQSTDTKKNNQFRFADFDKLQFVCLLIQNKHLTIPLFLFFKNVQFIKSLSIVYD